MKTNGQKSVFVKQCIFTALMQLLNQKPFDKIKISEIADRAGVSRMSFYRYYNKKEDILIEHLDQDFNDFTNEINKIPGLKSHDFWVFFVNKVLGDTFILRLELYGLSDLLIECTNKYTWTMITQFFDWNLEDPAVKQHYEYNSAGLQTLMANCLLSEKPVSKDMIVKTIETSFPVKQ